MHTLARKSTYPIHLLLLRMLAGTDYSVLAGGSASGTANLRLLEEQPLDEDKTIRLVVEIVGAAPETPARGREGAESRLC